MCSNSVAPIPSRIGFPVLRVHSSNTGAGNVSPADTAILSEESLKLAETLGLNGTPSYVIGDDVVVGAVGLDALRVKIATARCGKETC